jgi:ribosomal protein L13
LPKGPLGRDKFKNLKVYKEDSHHMRRKIRSY